MCLGGRPRETESVSAKRGLEQVELWTVVVAGLLGNEGVYWCGWCRRWGSAVWEQVAELLVRLPASGRLRDGIRYCCFVCGQEVRPIFKGE